MKFFMTSGALARMNILGIRYQAGSKLLIVLKFFLGSESCCEKICVHNLQPGNAHPNLLSYKGLSKDLLLRKWFWLHTSTRGCLHT